MRRLLGARFGPVLFSSLPKVASWALLVGLIAACNRNAPSPSKPGDASPAAKAPAKPSAELPVGSEAPDLVAQDHRGQMVSLRAENSPITLVYFYPKNNTPG